MSWRSHQGYCDAHSFLSFSIQIPSVLQGTSRSLGGMPAARSRKIADRDECVEEDMAEKIALNSDVQQASCATRFSPQKIFHLEILSMGFGKRICNYK